MPPNNDLLPWHDPEWQVEVQEWIEYQLNRLHLTATGPAVAHQLRPWSAVFQVPTASGTLYFKAAIPAFAAEASFLPFLARTQPNRIVQPLAAESDSGWLLLPDAGTVLRSLKGTAEGFRFWEQAVPTYAALQIEAAQHAGKLLGLGMTDRRLTLLPVQLEELLADREVLLLDQSDGLSSPEHEELMALRPHFSSLCQELDAFGLPDTVQHDDFHGNNMYISPAGRILISDWGDASISHPFFTLVTGLRSVAFHYDLTENDPKLARLRHAYLEVWQEYLPAPSLQEAFDLAQRVGLVSRAMTWHLLVKNLSSPFREQYAGGLPGWLKDFLEGER